MKRAGLFFHENDESKVQIWKKYYECLKAKKKNIERYTDNLLHEYVEQYRDSRATLAKSIFGPLFPPRGHSFFGIPRGLLHLVFGERSSGSYCCPGKNLRFGFIWSIIDGSHSSASWGFRDCGAPSEKYPVSRTLWRPTSTIILTSSIVTPSSSNICLIFAGGVWLIPSASSKACAWDQLERKMPN